MIGTEHGQCIANNMEPKRLKRSELLFAENETSKSMYLIKSGMIRIFKKKGDSDIEIETLRAGQIVGELAFLDGNPRSASGEAITETELIEISGPAYQAALENTPEWMKILLKTIVGRLRTATTRLKQLENASTSYDYSEKDGKRVAKYTFINTYDSLKIASAILLVAARNGVKEADGIQIKISLLEKYANQIMGIPQAKITSMCEILGQVGVMTIRDETGAPRLRITDIDLLEKYIYYQNEQNLLEPEKQTLLNWKAFAAMAFIAKQLQTQEPKVKYEKKDETTVRINVAEIKKLETVDGKEPFKLEDFTPLSDSNICSVLELKSGSEAYTSFEIDKFLMHYKIQRIIKSIDSLNEQKKKA